LGGFSYAVPFGPDSASLLLKAVNQMYATVPALKGQVEQYNHKILWHRVIGDYGIMSKTPVKTLGDLDGMKVATIGAYHPKILKEAGAVPVIMGVATRYQSMQTNIIAGSVLPFDLNKNIRIHELAKHGTRLGLGAAFSTSVSMNREIWNQLSPEIQKIMLEVGDEASAKYASENDLLGGEAIKEMEAAGATFYDMSAADKAKWANMLPDFPAMWAQEMNKKGLPGTRIMSAYLDITEKLGVKHAREWGSK
jgi:TRAP-type C4-dicarboxylate transport system substrate-binding protein